MARGIYPFYARITTDTDTALIAAPGAGQRINIRELIIDVETAKASGVVRIEEGAGTDVVIATLDASDDNNRLARAYHVSSPTRGRQLAENTALSAETTNVASGGVVVVQGSVEVS